jgi:hypothetical protein
MKKLFFIVEIINAHRFALPDAHRFVVRVFQGGNAPEAWAMTSLVALKRAVGIINDATLYGLHGMKTATCDQKVEKHLISLPKSLQLNSLR